MFSHHVSLRGDAKRERVDAAGGEDGEVRSQSAAGGQSHLLLKDAAGRQHRGEAAVRILELVEDLEGRSHVQTPGLSNLLPGVKEWLIKKGKFTSVHLIVRPSDSNSVS